MKHDTFDGEFGIISPCKQGHSAIRYYRSEVPLNTMGRLNLAKTLVADGSTGPPEEINRALLAADVIVAWRPFGEEGYLFTEDYTKLKPVSKKGRTLYPPIVIIDSDDAVDYVHPFNYVFSSLGIRNWDGELLKPGDSVEWEFPDGKTETMWKDKVTTGQAGVKFDIARNIQDIRYHFDTCRLAHGMTVTCEPLAKLYREQVCPKCVEEIDENCKHEEAQVYVFPNSVVPEDYYFPPLAPHEGVRILWEGGASHMDSWFPIRDAFVQCLKEHPEAKLVVFGNIFSWMKELIAPEQLELHGWIDYAAYKMKRTLLDIDINFCPLSDMMFTRCKSAIRWYEGSLGPRPEVALAANCGPYLEIEDGETGLTYSTPEEMKEKLSSLITNADLRKRLASAGQKWVLDNRHAEKTVPGLLAFYKELKARQARESLALVR